jgi:hypothetical protein
MGVPGIATRTDHRRNSMSARISHMNAVDLIGRVVINPNGAEFQVVGLEFDAADGKVVIWLSPFDEDGELIADDRAGVDTLNNWTIGTVVVR